MRKLSLILHLKKTPETLQQTQSCVKFVPSSYTRFKRRIAKVQTKHIPHKLQNATLTRPSRCNGLQHTPTCTWKLQKERTFPPQPLFLVIPAALTLLRLLGLGVPGSGRPPASPPVTADRDPTCIRLNVTLCPSVGTKTRLLPFPLSL